MKNRQGLTIAALIIAIVGLSIGFAAFSNTLSISSGASVNPSDANFVVQFSKLSGSDATGDQNPITPDNASYGVNGLIPTSNKRTLTGLKATFTAPGQSVTYSFYTKNAGALKAYLTSVNFAEVATGVTKQCTAKAVQSPATPATQSLVNAACNGISLTVTLGSESFTQTTARAAFTTATAHDLDAGDYETVTVVIAYAANSAQADGDFDVTFGDVTLNYSSVAS